MYFSYGGTASGTRCGELQARDLGWHSWFDLKEGRCPLRAALETVKVDGVVDTSSMYFTRTWCSSLTIKSGNTAALFYYPVTVANFNALLTGRRCGLDRSVGLVG